MCHSKNYDKTLLQKIMTFNTSLEIKLFIKIDDGTKFKEFIFTHICKAKNRFQRKFTIDVRISRQRGRISVFFFFIPSILPSIFCLSMKMLLEVIFMAEQNVLSNNHLAETYKGISTERYFTAEQFQRDIDYYRAQKIADSLFRSGLISLVQFNKLTELNRKSFSPFLAEIMPETVDNTENQS